MIGVRCSETILGGSSTQERGRVARSAGASVRCRRFYLIEIDE